MVKYIVIILILYGNLEYLNSQTCCTAGPPISSLLAITNTENSRLSIQFNYEYKSINRLVADNMVLTNDPRKRYGQNLAFKLDYTINQKLAVAVLFPMVHQNRTTVSESHNSLGPGDLTLLGQFSFLKTNFVQLFVSTGLKLPTGKTSHEGPLKILLSPDMQSGSGSIDYIFRAGGSLNNFIFPLMNTGFTVSYKKNNPNEDFGRSDNFSGRKFAFGNEFISTLWLSHQFVSKNAFWIPELAFNYRWTDANMEQDIEAPNSGGHWISIPFGLSFLPNNKISLRATIELPVYQKLEGLQITTDLALGFQMKYNFLLQNLQ